MLYIDIYMFVVALHPSNISGHEGNEYRLMKVRTHGDFIVLSHWETWPPAP